MHLPNQSLPSALFPASSLALMYTSRVWKSRYTPWPKRWLQSILVLTVPLALLTLLWAELAEREWAAVVGSEGGCCKGLRTPQKHHVSIRATMSETGMTGERCRFCECHSRHNTAVVCWVPLTSNLSAAAGCVSSNGTKGRFGLVALAKLLCGALHSLTLTELHTDAAVPPYCQFQHNQAGCCGWKAA